MYYTVRPKRENWIKWFKMRREMKGSYSMRDFAKNAQFAPSFVSEVLSGYREPNVRFMAISVRLTGLSFEELYRIEEIHPVIADERIPRRMQGQLEKIF